MTFIAITKTAHTKTYFEYSKIKDQLISEGFRESRNYSAATHFNKANVEVIVYKDF